MPNWAYSSTKVTGPKESLKKMLDYGKDHIRHFSDGDAITLGSWIPRPETYIKYDTTNYPDGKGLKIGKPSSWAKDSPIVTQELIDEYKKATKEQREKYGAVGWYEWNCKNYGCKWDCPIEITEKDDEVVFIISSPWDTPDEWFKRMSEMYPDLVFTVNCSYEMYDKWYVIEFRNGVYTKLDEGYYEYEEEEETETAANEALNIQSDDGLPDNKVVEAEDTELPF